MRHSYRSTTASSVEQAARELLEFGPIIPVVVSAINQVDKIITKALIDTGAQANCIKERLAKRLALTVIGDAWINGVSENNRLAREQVDTVLGILSPQDISVDLPTQFAVARFNSSNDDIAILLGRPFLHNFDMNYEGSIGRFSLEWQPPSLIYQHDL